MEVVKLRVDVDKKELNQMRADVNQIKSELKQVSTVFSDGQFVRHIKVANEALGVTRKTITDFKNDGTHVTETLTKDFEKMAKAAEKAAKKQQQDYEKAEKAMLAAADKSAKEQIALEKRIQQEIEKTRQKAAQKTQELIRQGQAAAQANAKAYGQDYWNYWSGVSGTGNKITASTSMFKGMSDEEFARYNPQAAEAAKTTQQFANSAKNASTMAERLSSNIRKFTEWYVVGNAIGALRRSLQDALDTMKEVDSQLVVVRKVTGMQGAELKALEEQAYRTATAYGVSADAYLESVAAFSRAGYGEQAAALAELSTKTQIVGDTTAETANQFLLSVDAAYKYKGNVEELTKVLDGANEIDNKYATSIEKIAEGMGIVAPVAAQAHMSINELASAIGTITATTQRSGAEASRALRALILNIIGDTKTEIDEGVTWTTGEIAGLKDVIKQYAPEAYAAAQATGSIIDPMEAIGGLAQSMKDGLLTEAQLMEMVSDIGGKLRTSQLLALIENWDMYKSMMQDFANAAGSADKEVSNALDSWERKTQILSNTWTEFISHLIETKEIKDALTAVTGLIKLLDSDLGRAATKGLLFYGALHMINTLMNGSLLSGAQLLVQHIMGISTAETLAATTSGVLAGAMNAIPFVAIITLVGMLGIGLYNLAEANKEVVKTTAELKDAYTEAAEELAKTQADITENNRLIEEANKTGGNTAYINRLKVENTLLQAQIDLQKEAKRDAAQEYLNSAYSGLTEMPNSYTRSPLETAAGILSALQTNNINPVWGADVYKKSIQELLPSLNDYVLAVENAKDAGVAITDEQQEAYDSALNLIGIYTDLYYAQNDVAQSTQDAALSLETLQERMTELNGQIDELQSSLSTLTAAQEEYNTYGSVSIDTVQKLLSLDAEYLNALFDESGALNLNSEAVANLLTDKSKLLQALAAEAIATYAAEEAERLKNNTTQEAGIVAENAKSRIEAAAQAALESGQKAAKGAEGWAALAASIAATYGGELDASKLQILQDNVMSYAENVRNLLANAGDGIGVWTGSSYTSSGSGSGGGSSSRSNPAKDALDAAKKEAELEKKKAQAQRDEEIAAIDEQIAQLKAQHEAQEDANKIAELQLAVEEAELALLNAQNERTVRYYNEATGQWEWIANNTDVLKAEQALEDARQKLADEEAQQAYEAQIAVLNEQKKGLQDYWKNAIARLDDTIDAINEKLSNINVNVTVNTGGGGGGGGGGGSGSGSGGSGDSGYKTGPNVSALQAFLNDYIGAGLVVDGVYGSATRNAVRSLQNRLKMAESGLYDSATSNKLISYLIANNDRATANRVPSPVYDQGGILRGMGGIKATNENEIVLPAKIARRMLSPVADSVFAKRLQELGFLYGGSGMMPSIAGSTWNRIGSQHNGNVYQFGGITISEKQARTMTVMEFAQTSRNLGMYCWDN